MEATGVRRAWKEGKGWSWRRGRWPNGGPDRLLRFTSQMPCVCVCVQNLGGGLQAVC